jgi:Ca2+-binding RTX toxin-like protein
LTEQAGSGTTDGVVINLGATTLTQSGIYTLTGKYLSSVAPTVTSGTSTYLFSNESTTNDAVADTLISIENATGTSGLDYIVGSTGDNVLTGLAGNDVLTGGDGADTFVFAATASGNGADTITDFTTASDKLNLAAFETAGTLVAVTGSLTTTAGTVYVLTGQAAGSADTAAAAATALSAAATWATGPAGPLTAWIVISDNNSTAIYSFTDAAASTDEVIAAELTLVGTITGTVATTDIVI